MSATSITAGPVPQSGTGADGWTRARMVLVVLWIIIGLTVITVGQRHSDYDDLQAAVSAGSVRQVTVTGAISPGSTGYALVEVTWRSGATKHLTEVWQINPDGDGGHLTAPLDGEQHPHVYEDVGQQLKTLRPDLQVEVADGPVAYGEVFGWRVPTWLSLAVLAAGLAQLFVLVVGPQPRLATRWAWFWLSWSGLGALAFLVFSGPTPGLPTPHGGQGGRRLTGGWALLISLLLGLLPSSGLV